MKKFKFLDRGKILHAVVCLIEMTGLLDSLGTLPPNHSIDSLLVLTSQITPRFAALPTSGVCTLHGTKLPSRSLSVAILPAPFVIIQGKQSPACRKLLRQSCRVVARQSVAKDCHRATDLMVLWGMDMMT